MYTPFVDGDGDDARCSHAAAHRSSSWYPE